MLCCEVLKEAATTVVTNLPDHLNLIITMINFNYMSGYLAYKQIGDKVKANTEIKCLRLYKYSDVN